MPKVLIPLADGFEEIEALAVVDVLRRAEFDVVLAGLHDGQVVSARKVNIIPDTYLDKIRAENFDMIILPGGQPGANNLIADKRVKRLLKEFSDKSKMIGAICAATTVLADAGVINNKQVTCYPSYSDKLGSASFKDKPVVTDGNIITSQGPGTAVTFALAIVSRLAGAHTAEKIEKAMLVKPPLHSENLWGSHLFNSTIQALLWALEMKDSYTQGHAKRVSEYSMSIGEKLQLPQSEMRDLYLGAMLHDIGKVATEQDLLRKTETLNFREETIIREHPLKGTLFILGIENLSQIVPTILHHHERWDGEGYPTKLKGEQIPLHARIVCLADAYAAMRFPRSFRPALDKEDAIREIQKEKGLQFDPHLADLMIECINESPFHMKDFSYYFS